MSSKDNDSSSNSDSDKATRGTGPERSGKVANDHNSTGEQPATQTNQGRRTPESRHDRETHVGSGNQTQSRRGAPGSSSSGTVGGGARGAG
jgi:hypothetical protein